MEIRSKTLGVVIAIVIFGGIMGASILGFWKPTLSKNSVNIQANQSTGIYDPAEIRGSHRFGDISALFDIPLEVLSRAFALPADIDPATFQNKDLETIYPEFEGEQEIGNGSAKWFVALYTALPYELESDEEDTYILRPAVDILMSHANLTAEQIAYINAYAIEIKIDSEPIGYSIQTDESQSSNQAESDEGGNADDRKQDEMVVAGQTTFADLLDWGMPVDQIEVIIGGEIPNRLILVRDYCIENGLSFGGIKIDLQAEIDKME